MSKITPFLWFDKNAEEAANFYISLFDNSRITNTSRYGEAGPLPKNTVMSIIFELEGKEFMALNGGPAFKFTPAISFFINIETESKIDELWKKLSQDGHILMEYHTYPFSKKYGWVEDKYGLSWQLNLVDKKDNHPPKIIPSLLFTDKNHSTAVKAIEFYSSVFKNSQSITAVPYTKDENELPDSVKYASFTLDNEPFIAMDSSRSHQFTFNEAISFFVSCQDQKEVDYYWDKLSQNGKKDQCGWLKDQFGISWQIVPVQLSQLLNNPDPKKANNVMKAMLQMKKIEINKLEAAAKE